MMVFICNVQVLIFFMMNTWNELWLVRSIHFYIKCIPFFRLVYLKAILFKLLAFLHLNIFPNFKYWLPALLLWPVRRHVFSFLPFIYVLLLWYSSNDLFYFEYFLNYFFILASLLLSLLILFLLNIHYQKVRNFHGLNKKISLLKDSLNKVIELFEGKIEYISDFLNLTLFFLQIW